MYSAISLAEELVGLLDGFIEQENDWILSLVLPDVSPAC